MDRVANCYSWVKLWLKMRRPRLATATPCYIFEY